MRARFLTWEVAVLGVIVLGVALPVIVFALSIVEFFVMPDELGYVKQAVMLGRGEPQTPGDFWFNSWSQLAPLLYAPVYRAFQTTTAFDLAHVLNAVAFASAAIPVWLLARRVLRWPPAALLVAAASVAIPWAGMAGTLMTEPVAYAASAWALLAMVHAVARPGPRSDVVALAALSVAFFARTQLIVLVGALVAAIALHELTRPDGGGTGARLRAAVVRHAVLGVVVAVAAVAVLVGGAEAVLGNYVSPAQRTLLPSGTLAAARELLAYVVVGIAIVPLPLAAAWAATALGRSRDPVAHAFACVAICVVPLLTLVGGAFTVGFTAGINDRYLFYVVPLLMTGMAAALLDRRRGITPALIAAGAVAALLVGTSELSQTGPSLVSPSMAFHEVLPGPATLAVASAAVVTAIALAASRVGERAMIVAVGGAVLAFGIVETQYTLRHVARTQAGASDEFVAGRNWIDRALPARARAVSVLAPFGDPHATVATWWDAAFWNKALERVYHLPGGGEYDQAFAYELTIDPVSGRVPALDPYRYVVRSAEDARFGLRGSRTIATHAGLAVLEAQRPYEAEWLMENPESVEGEIAPGTAVAVKVFERAGDPIEQVAVDLRVRPVGSDRQRWAIASAGERRRGTLRPGERTRVVVPVEFKPGAAASLELRAGTAEAPLRLLSVLPVN